MGEKNMNEVTTQDQIKAESFRFEIYKGKLGPDGTFVKTRVAGHAYLRSGKHAYKVKLFTLTQDRFVIVPGDESSDHYKILTKDEVQTKDKGKRTYWNVVGDAEVQSKANVLKLKFDLFGEPLYMSLFPSNGGNVIPFEPFRNLSAA
jgi:hypothetical protein